MSEKQGVATVEGASTEKSATVEGLQEDLPGEKEVKRANALTVIGIPLSLVCFLIVYFVTKNSSNEDLLNILCFTAVLGLASLGTAIGAQAYIVGRGAFIAWTVIYLLLAIPAGVLITAVIGFALYSNGIY